MLNKKALAASVSAPETDDDFNQTVLLLHGDGTNGAQNNTFTDSSTNNFTITRNGNTTQGTFSPFSVSASEWSNYFDGTGDYLSSSKTQTVPATGDFTVDGWFYLNTNSYSNFPSIFSQGTSGTSGRFVIFINNDGKLAIQITASLVTFGSAVTPFQWNYFAVTRSGSTITVYLNGSSIGTTTNSDSIQNTTPLIGSEWNGDPYRWQGYLSNIRVSNTIRSISLPTAPFTSDGNTTLLACQSNRFVDTSGTPATLTPFGNTSVQPFSPFAPSAAYSASTNGGSGYFDGTGDTLVSPTDSALALGTSNFCVEFWFDAAGVSQPATKRIIGNVSGGSWGSNKWTIGVDGNNIFVQIYNLTTTNQTISTTTNVLTAQWNHIALCRSGNDFGLFINGTRVGTYSSSGTMDGGGNQNIVVGGNGLSGETIAGYIADFRTVIGSSVYTPTSTTLTVPTAPLIAITNTKLLLNFTGAAIFDQTGKNNLETVGNAQIDTTTKKYGTGSMEFDGTGDALWLPSSPNIELGSGDFTIEFWIYPNATTSQNVIRGGTQYSFGILIDSGRYNVYISANGSTWGIASGWDIGAVSTGSWALIAITRSGSTFRGFVNGTKAATDITSSSAINALNGLWVGTETNYSGNLNAFIDDLRITKGIARYTANFTAPTKAFPDQ